jgi:hypothetical protein
MATDGQKENLTGRELTLFLEIVPKIIIKASKHAYV